jgi:hypothetical protein
VIWSKRVFLASASFANLLIRSARFSRWNATLAQLVEQLIRNQQVAGSNPAGGSNKSLDKAADLVQAALSDIATQNIEAAKKNLKSVEAAVQAIRGSVE